MENILISIKKSIDAQNWYSALVLSLIVPDICGKIENNSSPKRYSEWFNKYLGEKYRDYLSGEDCYALRCSYLHEGTGNIENQNAKEVLDRIEFITNGPHLNYFENCQFGNSKYDGKTFLILSNVQFCNDIIEAAQKWIFDNKDNKDFQQNINDMLLIKNEFSI